MEEYMAWPGNPNLGEVREHFDGVENLKLETLCTEVWF